MADTTYSVRMPQELKDKIGDLAENSGLKGKEFMEQLIQSYEINKTKEVVPMLEQDLEELQTLTRRINSIYINIGERVDSMSKAKDLEYKELIDKKESIIDTLQGKINALEEINSIVNADVQSLENELKDLKEQNINLESKYFEDINKFTEINNSNKALIEEYKSKIDTLSGVVAEYKQYKVDIEEVKNKLQEAIEDRDSFSNDNIRLHQEVNKLKTALEDLKSKHKEDIEALKDKLDFENDKALLERDKKYQEQIQKIKESNNAEVRGYLEKMEQKDKDFLEQEKKHQLQIQDIENKKDKKIEELLQEIEKLK